MTSPIKSPALNRTLWAVALVLFAVFGMKARTLIEADLQKVGTLSVRQADDQGILNLKWIGEIEAPMAQRIAEAVDDRGSRARTIILSLSSPGGALDHGAEVVRLLRKLAQSYVLETAVESGDSCASMCVPVYLQGTRRVAAADAHFMFHDVSFKDAFEEEDLKVPDASRTSATDRLFAKYFEPAGVSRTWLDQLRTKIAGGHEVWETARQLEDERAGIVQQLTGSKD